MVGSVWRRFLGSVTLARRFPPPQITSEAQARAVRAALEAFLGHDEGRFRHLFLSEEPLALDDAERPWMEVLSAGGYARPILPNGVRPCVRVFFLDDLFIATDLLSNDADDQVFSLMLEQVLIVRLMDVRAGDHVLELCLGSGVNAIAAGRRGAARIVGVDISQRALAFAAANAAVNLVRERGEPPLEMLRGSLFEPLPAQDRFDLIVVNPPFELVPPGTSYYLHSHGGEDGLDVVRALLPGVARRLRPGGRFEMYTWTPGDEHCERVSDLVAAALPRHRIELRCASRLPLEERIDTFSNHADYADWRARLRTQGITHVWGVHLRASQEGPAGVVRIDAAEDVQACRPILARWGEDE
jgi:SAM-dependent methyltransferase